MRLFEEIQVVTINEILNEDITKLGAKLTKEVVNSFFDAFDDLFKSNMDLTDIAKLCGKRLDEIILNEEKNGLSYSGGMFHINYLNEVSFETAYELYFQDENKEWVKKEAKSKPQKMSFLNETSQTELRKNNKVSFEIDPPNRQGINTDSEKQ